MPKLYPEHSMKNSDISILKDRFQVIALTPPGLPDPAIAIAASRAGGIGILDLEFNNDVCAAVRNIKETARFSQNTFGIKLNGEDGSFITGLLPELPENLGVVMLTYCKPEKLRGYVKEFHKKDRLVFLEVTSLEQAISGQDSGVDGFIGKGSEAGGFASEKTSFVLLQQLCAGSSLPVWIQGGIGLHTAAACYAAGAAGIVLDSQLLLTKESPLPEHVKKLITVIDSRRTICIGNGTQSCRIYGNERLPVVKELMEIERSLQLKEKHEAVHSLSEEIRKRIAWGKAGDSVWLLGQDVAFAGPLAKRYGTVGSIIQALRNSIDEHLRTAKSMNILNERSPLALSHGTLYPIVQGPMARVSDKAAFAARVAEGGSLPFIALSMLGRDSIEKMLEDVAAQMGTRPWGVGILGFNEGSLLKSQMEAVEAYSPQFAIIAGGMPKQVTKLESKGIKTYAHVQTASIMKMFIDNGARRFIFEGRECGGHIGPISSFVLWEEMIGSLLEILKSSEEPEKFHVLFAGGIHNARSAAMVAAMAAPLAELGVLVGVVMGTAYLFTEEAVESGTIVSRYQKNALECTETHVLRSGPGHSIRCCKTPLVENFENEKRRLESEGLEHDQIRAALEKMFIGRLHIASKGITSSPEDRKTKIVLSEKEQNEEGIYMIGQLAALRDRTCTVEDLHHDVSVKSAEILSSVSLLNPDMDSEAGVDIAIIGMSCSFPKAGNLREYWENILNKVNAITEIPSNRWEWKLYFDNDKKTRDKIYSRWGGFLDDIPFDPLKYGMPPNSLKSIEPLHLMTLEAVDSALKDAGYENREFNRAKTSVILGTGGGVGDIGQGYIFRALLPSFIKDPSEKILCCLPEWTEDSFAGILENVLAGRVANRFNLGGVNYIVDAACASSLAALYDSVKELETGRSDVVLAGGVDSFQSPFTYLCFSKTQALSQTGQCRVFDENANGTVISEGLGILVLKRLSDAERDGDNIYAVLKSITGSSDGRAKSMTAPSTEGQVQALKRAYKKAGFSPATVSLFEAHGTGTVVGDRTESESVSQVLKENNAEVQDAAIGSVKSMIGHTKGAAGMAGVIKIALSLRHKVLTPTLGVTRPNMSADFQKGPLYLNTETRPWIGNDDHPRRAGINAFGFGGTNFHAVFEEYTGNYMENENPSVMDNWPAELLLWSADSRTELISSIEIVEHALKTGANIKLGDLALTLYEINKEKSGSSPRNRVALMALSLEDLKEKLGMLINSLNDPSCNTVEDPRGIFFSADGHESRGKTAFLFPGQGSQYPDMFRELAIFMPEIRSAFERADSVLKDSIPERLSKYVYPSPVFSPDEEKNNRIRLARTDIAQPALGAASYGMFTLLKGLNIQPDMVAGHSYGEYTALCSAGVFDERSLYEISEARGRLIMEAAKGHDLGVMAAVEMEESKLAGLLDGIEGVTIANINAPKQSVISGEKDSVLKAVDNLASKDINIKMLPVSGAFHSPVVEPARKLFSNYLKDKHFSAPQIEVFSNTYAAPYKNTPKAIKDCLSEHMVRQVKFIEEIEAMYENGARIFVEVGPGSVLTGLTKQILQGRPAAILSTDIRGQGGLKHLMKSLGQLTVSGIDLSLERFFKGRSLRRLDLGALEKEEKEKFSATTWFVNGTGIRPASDKSSPSDKLSGHDKEMVNDHQRPDGKSNRPDKRDHASPAPPSAFQANTEDVIDAGSAAAFRDDAMLRYNRLMARFLKIQKSTMLAYLNGQTAAVPAKKAALDSAVAFKLGDQNENKVILPKEVKDIKDEDISVPRFLFEAVEKSLPDNKLDLSDKETIILTYDGRGVSDAVAQELRQRGANVVVLKMGPSETGSDSMVYSADLGDPDTVESVIGDIRSAHGQISGVIHLLPLGHAVSLNNMDIHEWRRSLRVQVKSLFYIARALGTDLRGAGQGGNAWFFAATGLSGPSLDPDNKNCFAGQAGISGLIKTAFHEWPEVKCSVMHMDLDNSAPLISEQIIHEMAAKEHCFEVEYRGTKRYVYMARSASLDHQIKAKVEIDRDSVIMVTGGAIGITAEIAHEFAVKYRPTLLLIGRSPYPEEAESNDTASLNSTQEIKAALIKRSRAAGETPSPASVESAYSRLMKDREIRSNISKLKQAGATVHYFQADVRDENQFGKLIDEIYLSFSRLDGVIHGAGIIEDKLLVDKTTESFDRVFDTKADSAFILYDKVRKESLKFIVFFTSVAGTFGNRGQADYAAANEAVNKLAVLLDMQCSARVVAINWGPWKKAGMVTPEVERQFRERGVQLIPLAAGAKKVDEEISYGDKGEVNILVGDGPWERTGETGSTSVTGKPLPFINSSTSSVENRNGSFQILKKLDAQFDLYLQDHCLDGKPVLPAAMAIEHMAETAQKGWGDLTVSSIMDVRIFSGFVLDRGPKEIRILAKETGRPVSGRNDVELEIKMSEAGQKGRISYSSKAILSERLEGPLTHELPDISDFKEFKMSAEMAYEKWLFHGPRFQCIRSIEGISENGIVATLVPSSADECVRENRGASWLIDPVILDSGPQLAILWARARKDMTALPSGFGAVHIYSSHLPPLIRCHFEVIRGADEQTFYANVYYMNTEGQLLYMIENLESTCSKSLNRLSVK